MSRFLETLYIHDGRIRNLDAHRRRMQRTVMRFYGAAAPDILPALARRPTTGVFRCRVLYDKRVTSITYHPYQRQKKTKLLPLTTDMDYSYKYADRTALEAMMQRAGEAGAEDALLIRDGLVTDTTVANIAFGDGRTWYTPARPLLRGTMRERLIEAGWLHPVTIRSDQIGSFHTVALMNALSGFYVVGDTASVIHT